MAPARRNEIQTAAPATSPAAPSSAKIPAPTIAPTPMNAAWRIDMVVRSGAVDGHGCLLEGRSLLDHDADAGGHTPPRFGWLLRAPPGITWSRWHARCDHEAVHGEQRARRGRRRGGRGQHQARDPAGDGHVRARGGHVADERLDQRRGPGPRHHRQWRAVRDRARGAGLGRVHPDREQGGRPDRPQARLRARAPRVRRRVRSP